MIFNIFNAGATTNSNEKDFSLSTLSKDFVHVVNAAFCDLHPSHIFLIGHRYPIIGNIFLFDVINFVIRNFILVVVNIPSSNPQF